MDGEHNAQTLVTPLPDSGQGAPSTWLPYAESPYLLGPRIAAGGMGRVHLGLKQGALGFRRRLAIKRLHGHLAQDPEFVARFKDEIRLVSQLNHPNIVQTFDVLETSEELALVMEYVEGVTLYQLLRDANADGRHLPVEVVVGVVAQTLHGLHSAHELCDEEGRPLHLVHRDVSPQNIMIARDGLAKILDFGVAKAASETHVTRTGQLSGKAAYMSPEQATGHAVDRRTDVFAAGVVLWEALTGQRLFRPPGIPEAAALKNVLEMRVKPPGELREDVPPALERVVLRALERDPTRRFGSARDFALALEEAVPFASLSAVASGVMEVSGPRLARLNDSLPSPARGETDGSGAPPPERVRPSIRANNALVAVQGELTRPIEGISVEGDPPQRSSRYSVITGLSVLGVALLAGLTFGTGYLTSSPFGSAGSAQPPTHVHSLQPTEARPPSDKLPQEAVQRQLEHQPPPVPVPGGITAARYAEGFHSGGGSPSAHVEERAMNEGATSKSAPAKSTERASPAPIPAANPSGTRLGSEDRATPASGSSRRVTSSKSTSSTRLDTSEKNTAANPSTARPAEAKPANGVNCSPPTYTDADGIRHYKPECL